MGEIKWVIDIGNITWPVMGIVISTFVFILIKNRMFPNIKVSKGNSTFEAVDVHVNGGKNTIVQCDKHNDMDEAMDSLIEQRYQTEKRITSMQVRIAMEKYDDFKKIERDIDPVIMNALWNSFIWSMNITAIENHILQYVSRESIDSNYVGDKVLPIIKCYASFSGKGLPELWEIEQKFRLFVITTLQEFSAVSLEEWKRFIGSVESLAGVVSNSHPALKKRIDRILIGVGIPKEDRSNLGGNHGVDS